MKVSGHKRKKRKKKKKKKEKENENEKEENNENDGEEEDEDEEEEDAPWPLWKRLLAALAPVLGPIFYACFFTPLNQIMSGEDVNFAAMVQSLMAIWAIFLIVGLMTDPGLFFPTLTHISIRWSFPLMFVLAGFFGLVLQYMYIFVGPDECAIDHAWEPPEEDPLEEAEPGTFEGPYQVIGDGTYFFGMTRVSEFEIFSTKHEAMLARPELLEILDENRLMPLYWNASFLMADAVERTLRIKAMINFNCPIQLYDQLLGTGITSDFRTKAGEIMEADLSQLPPENDRWKTMSSGIYERELTSELTSLLNARMRDYYSQIGATLFSSTSISSRSNDSMAGYEV